MVDSMRGSVDAWLGELLSADLYVAAADYRDGAVLPEAAVRELSALPALRAASRYRQRSVHLAQRQVSLIGAHLSGPSRQGFELLSGAGKATWEDFDGGGLLISEPLAWHLGLERGAVVVLPTASGNAPFRVAGIFRDFASEHGRLFMDEATFLEHWPGTPVSSLALFAAGGDVAGLRRALDASRAGGEALAVTPARLIHEESLAVFDRTFRITGVLRVLLLGVAFIGVFGALMALQLERGREFAVWRALGMRRGQVAALIGGESLLMGLVAACLAVPTGLLMAWLLIVSVQRRAFGWTMGFAVDPALLLQSVLVGLSAAALAALYPLWRAAVWDPAPLLREE
jgi:putative ABC transport system permease protein